jgi:RNA polymerase sigma factor (sigma-70 family)
MHKTQGKPMESTEKQRMELAQALVDYQSMIQAYSYAIVRDFHLAEDVYQDVALIVAKKWDTIDYQDKNVLVPWLREITRRKSLEAGRRHRRIPVLLPQDIVESMGEEFILEESNSDVRQKRERLFALLSTCVKKLKGAARIVIQKRYGEERALSCEEIAENLGRSVEAVYSIARRARLSLIRCVQQEELQQSGMNEA